MVKQGSTSATSRGRKVPSHRDLVKTVSKQLKYYFEVKRQEDGFDLSGPECPRPDYPALKSRPMLLYEGLHDRSVKHFYSDHDVKQRITHMHTGNASTTDAKRTEKLMKKTMDKVSYVPAPLIDFIDRVYHDKPPWMGVGMNGGNTKYTKNSEKYVSGTLGEWSMKPKKSRRKGYGNPEPTLQKAFSEPPHAKPRMRRSCPSGWIDNKECRRLITGASRILTSSEFREALSRPQSSKSASQRSSMVSESRARSVSPETAKSGSVTSYSAVRKSSQSRLTHRPQSSSNSLQRRTTSYHDAKDDVVTEHERQQTSQNLKKGKIYYDIDGRRKPVPHKVKNDEGYLEREDVRSSRSPDEDDKVPDWLRLVGVKKTAEEKERNEVRKQDVEEKRMPYNNSVRHVEPSNPDTARSEDVSKREGVRRRPKSAKRSKSRSSRGERDRDSHVTLSDGSYEEVKLDDSESGEEAYYEDRGCQTGWELFVQYDQSENILYDGETESARYKVTVRTGSSVGASTKASVHLILYGNRGRSPDLPLVKSENHKILFQQNASDVFYVTCSYVGTLNKISIGHDSDSEAWYLDSVTVEDPIKREAFEFICNGWLSVKSADKKTRRHLEITASRHIQPDAGEDEEEDEQEEEVKEKVESRGPATPAVAVSKSGTVSSVVSTSHLRNDTDTVDTTDSKGKGSISLPSETDSTITQGTQAKRGVRLQEPFVAEPSRRHHDRTTPDNLDDFESDITLYGDRKTVSSRRSESIDSEERTARFEERSVLSQNTEDEKRRQETDRLEAFKAGQRAERERQRQEEEKVKQAEATHQSDLLQGPTIHHAAKTGNLARVKQLLDHNDELKNSVDALGNTPLHLATIQGHKETVQYLAATGADLDSRDQIGYEPVHMAALHGHVNCLMILVAMGASIHSKADDCKLPLHLAAMSGNMETCKWLVANRSRLDEEDDFGRTPVDMAENNGHADVAHFLRTCINELKERRSSLESLLIGKDEWKDDKPERPITYHDGDSDSDPGGSVVDLRRAARLKEEKAAKQKAYDEMQQKMANSDMTYLDRIRYEVDHS